MKKNINYNSKENQKIKAKLVEREVLACFSYEMEAVMKAGESYRDKNYPLPTYDDVENLYSLSTEDVIYNILTDFENQKKDFLAYANNPDTFNRSVKTKGGFEVFLNSLNEDELRKVCEELNYDCEEEPQEIFEWWIVSKFLYEKLKCKGEPVLEWGNNYYWGRTCTGQAILLDEVISEIAEEMEILQGQKWDWSK